MVEDSNQEQSFKFSAEQSQAIRDAEVLFEKGEGMTAEQAHELARKRTEAWLKAPNNKSA